MIDEVRLDDRLRARDLDAADPLARFRTLFNLPRAATGEPSVYLAGQSLGAQPKSAQGAVDEEMEAWARLGVDGHFRPGSAWFEYDDRLRDAMAGVVGASPAEVVLMNSLTTNLHLLMASFFRPAGRRTRILIDAPTFPSDYHAVVSQLQLHGLDPATDLVVVAPAEGSAVLEMGELEAAIRDQGERLAMVLLAGVNFATGQVLDIQRLTATAHDVGAIAGWDLAHAAGNVELSLSGWDVDFAAWCTYKYLNSGPGAVAGAFVHERLSSAPRLSGWWGTSPAHRFSMEPQFHAAPGAAGWRLSNPPILALAPVAAALDIFASASMPALRAKSMQLTGYLADLLGQIRGLEVITPTVAAQRGAQLSVRFMNVEGGVHAVHRALEGRGIVCDVREPDIIRLAPVPLYNSFHDAWQCASAIAEIVQ